MKKILTIMLGVLFMLAAAPARSQSIDAQAENQTKVMNQKFKLDDTQYARLHHYNLERLQKIEALATLREQDPRYLDLRLDQIEEEYASRVYNLLNKKQYTAFMNYKKDQPYTYAGLTMKNNQIAIERER